MDQPGLNDREWLLNRAAKLHERGELEEAFNVNQPRFPKGHPKAGQWRPKLVTGVGGRAPGHLERDLGDLLEHIQTIQSYGPNVSQRDLDDIGQRVQKVALKYSARREYVKRLEALRNERQALQDKKWDGYEKAWKAASPAERDALEPEQFLDPKDAEKIAELSDEEIRLLKQRDHADIDAMLGVLQKIRPMGGKLKTATPGENKMDLSAARKYASESRSKLDTQVAANADLDASLKQILKLIPKAWLDDTNAKGTTSFLFSTERAYADTQTKVEKRSKDHFREMEDSVDAALKGKLDRKLTGQAAIALMTDEGDRLHRDAPLYSDESDAWRARRDARAEQLATQKYKWVGRVASGQPEYPKGLWAVVEGKDDGRRYWVDWGGNIHPIKPDEQVIEGKREDRRLKGPLKLTAHQEQGLNILINQQGGTYAGMYDGKYPVVRHADDPKVVSGEQAPIGPYAPMYSWIDENGVSKNLTYDASAPDGKFEEAKWDKEAPLLERPARRQDTLIKIDPTVKHTLLHELCHRMEIVYGEENRAGYSPISMATHSFLTSRTQGEEIQKLKDIYPGYAYEEHEVTRPDKFVDGYVGKLYPGQATEVLTMGMEMLFYPRYGRDIEEDPGHRRLILGILAAL